MVEKQELEKQVEKQVNYNLADKTQDSRKIISEKFSASSIENIDIPRKTDQLNQDIKPILKNP